MHSRYMTSDRQRRAESSIGERRVKKKKEKKNSVLKSNPSINFKLITDENIAVVVVETVVIVVIVDG